MILSVSRRTDIPNYYADWFFNRIKEGFVCVRNPMNPYQVSRIPITSDVVDCIVFWTKNPEPMLERLQELSGYEYYFQFTLTCYGSDVEPGVPHKREKMISVFQRLSEKIGAERVIWRYDPVFFNENYTPEYHVKAFSQIAEALSGYTKKCVISFVDEYAKNKKKLERMEIYAPEEEELYEFAGRLSRIAGKNGMEIGSCAEQVDLSRCGIIHNSCIDKALIESLLRCSLKGGKDTNQRHSCGCMESVEIGTYNTCKNGCVYCYANESMEAVANTCKKYNPLSLILCGEITESDKVTERKVKSLKEGQLQLDLLN